MTASDADPQARDLPFDGHLHTRASSDAARDLEVDDYARQAVERHIDEIVITDHIDFDPRWPNHAPDVPARERVVREAAEHWAPLGLTIRFGVEVSFESGRVDEIRDHLARQPYDAVIGSVHVGSESVYHRDRVAAWVAGRSLGEIVEPYFGEVIAAAGSGLFDTIGHLDFVKRYLVPHVPPDAVPGAPELYEPVLRALVEAGVALEVNTSGLRQAADALYPPPEIVARFRALGGRRVTVGSDAHRAEHFAYGLRDGYRAAIGAGYRRLDPRRDGPPIDLSGLSPTGPRGAVG